MKKIESGVDCPRRSDTYRKSIFCGWLYVIITYYRNSPYEVLITGDKDSMCANSYNYALADSITYKINRMDGQEDRVAICKNLRLHRCNKYAPNKDKIQSCADAIGQVLQTVLSVSDNEIFGR